MCDDNWHAEMVAKATEAAEHLIGTCESLYTNYEEYMNDTIFCAVLDDKIFECTKCGWWHDISDCNDHPESGEWVCPDCL